MHPSAKEQEVRWMRLLALRGELADPCGVRLFDERTEETVDWTLYQFWMGLVGYKQPRVELTHITIDQNALQLMKSLVFSTKRSHQAYAGVLADEWSKEFTSLFKLNDGSYASLPVVSADGTELKNNKIMVRARITVGQDLHGVVAVDAAGWSGSYSIAELWRKSREDDVFNAHFKTPAKEKTPTFACNRGIAPQVDYFAYKDGRIGEYQPLIWRS